MGRTILSGVEASGICTRDVLMCDLKENGINSPLKLVIEAVFLFVFVISTWVVNFGLIVSILNNVSINQSCNNG